VYSKKNHKQISKEFSIYLFDYMMILLQQTTSSIEAEHIENIFQCNLTKQLFRREICDAIVEINPKGLP